MTERDDVRQRRTGDLGRPTFAGATARSSVVDTPISAAAGPGRRTEATAADPAPSRRTTVQASRGARRARLTLRRIDPWSTMKFSLVLSVVLFIVWVVAVALLYGLLAAMGVFSKLNESIVQFTGSNSASIESVISAKTVLTSAIVVGLVDIVLFTALATLFAVIYNLCADLVGGVEVTLAEGD